MKLLFDFLPIIVFFITYYVWDIYTATAAAIVASILQVASIYIRGKKPEMMHWLALIMIITLGGATLFFRNEMFIKWKPTGVYWLLGIVFLVSQWVGKKPLVRSMLEKSVSVPHEKWIGLNLCWVSFFIMMGIINLIVVYNFDTETWVNFKLFGSMALTFLFVLGQGFYLMKYMPENENEQK